MSSLRHQRPHVHVRKSACARGLGRCFPTPNCKLSQLPSRCTHGQEHNATRCTPAARPGQAQGVQPHVRPPRGARQHLLQAPRRRRRQPRRCLRRWRWCRRCCGPRRRRQGQPASWRRLAVQVTVPVSGLAAGHLALMTIAVLSLFWPCFAWHGAGVLFFTGGARRVRRRSSASPAAKAGRSPVAKAAGAASPRGLGAASAASRHSALAQTDATLLRLTSALLLTCVLHLR